MNENNKKEAIKILKDVEEVLSGAKKLFPRIFESKAKRKAVIAKDSYADPLKTLKRVNGIISNFNENNAEEKLKNLLAFLYKMIIE